MQFSKSLRNWSINGLDYLNSNGKDNVVCVHLLNLNDLDYIKLLNLLSDDELIRARLFHFDKDRIKFIKVRGALRLILGQYLDIYPEMIQFNYGNNGKPELKFPDSNQLGFNLSHSGNRAIIGITDKYLIGIDIEEVNNKIDPIDIAHRFFSENEIMLLDNAMDNEKHKLFYQLWTRKEALLKAVGIGISTPLENIDVSDFTGDRYISLSTNGNDHELKKWYARNLIDDKSFIATIVTNHYIYEIKIIESI
ncbi:4'-phosphopantetheinyl transferase family protein [Tamlana flava]|uniref:4'-phosphopantetheinyl transferase family protein n=1 Tax=Tamlana flava TaxID=3158572 RepID=UPI00351B3CDC